uniref:Uncharacterized protein LOC104245096 isoform X2 n=1 Tax=Nicotiana sylvestris TaxID=4096 RepID=A0A1U7Y4C3_NICSY|nr:PREDICTED: uncharacterized protein LOC104245096 isoform X2 [Nicotiana sylvestris]
MLRIEKYNMSVMMNLILGKAKKKKRAKQMHYESKDKSHMATNLVETLGDQITVVRRDHERRSQTEKRRIRDDTAREETKRKQITLQKEKARQETIRAKTSDWKWIL